MNRTMMDPAPKELLQRFLDGERARPSAWLLERLGAGGLRSFWDECRSAEALMVLGGIVADRRSIVLAACACVSTVMELVPEGESRPRRAIEAALAWTRCELSAKEVEGASDEAFEARSDAWSGDDDPSSRASRLADFAMAAARGAAHAPTDATHALAVEFCGVRARVCAACRPRCRSRCSRSGSPAVPDSRATRPGLRRAVSDAVILLRPSARPSSPASLGGRAVLVDAKMYCFAGVCPATPQESLFEMRTRGPHPPSMCGESAAGG